MRPLVCTSGNYGFDADEDTGPGAASMRPLVCTSGNRGWNGSIDAIGANASMRPLVCTSGNRRDGKTLEVGLACFNEAAGLHQRKPLMIGMSFHDDIMLQ